MDELNPLQQPAYPPASGETIEQLRAELREQRALVEENHKMLRSMKRSLWISTVLDILRLLIIVVPLIILAYILPPLVQKYLGMFEQYQQAIDGTNGTLPQGFDVNQIRDLLNKSGLL